MPIAVLWTSKWSTRKMNINPFRKEPIEVAEFLIVYKWWKSYPYVITCESTSTTYGCKDLESARSLAQGETRRRQDALVEKLKGE